jgi:hypothetical protein
MSVTGSGSVKYFQVLGNPTLFRILCEGLYLSAIDPLMWRKTAVFSALRNPNVSIVQTLIDAKMDFGMDK